jgi:hypothetical protein
VRISESHRVLGVGTYQLSFTPSGGAPVTKVLKITN